MSGSNPLDKANVEDIMALTPLQEGLLFHYRSGQNKGHYTQQFALRMAGSCCVATFKQAWQDVARVNELLRTVYRWERLEKPIQIVLKEHEIPIEVHDYSQCSSEQSDAMVEEIKCKDRSKELNLEVAPMRMMLCLLPDEACELVMTWHHILFDGWSNGVLLKEFLEAYQANAEGEARLQVERRKTPFKRYVQLLKQEDKRSQQAYWEQELAGWQERTFLDVHHDDESDQWAAGAKGSAEGRYSVLLPKVKAEAITTYTQRHQVTLAALLYTAWGLLLGRYSKSEDVLFGTTVSGRPPELAGVEEMIGLFINTIPIRVSWQAEDSVHQLVRNVNAKLIRRMEHELTPLVEISGYSGADSHAPLFNTIMVLENYPLDRTLGEGGPLRIERYAMEESTHYGMTIGIQPLRSGELEVDFAYAAASFSHSMVRRLGAHFVKMIEQIMEQDELRIRELDLLTDEERTLLLDTFSQGPMVEDKAVSPNTDTIHARFELQAEQTPHRIAIHCGDHSLTYEELNKAANQVASRLRFLGIQAGEPVAIWLDRSEKLIIAMLGVLKSGAAYVPIDADYAPGRIQQILDDCAPRMVITTEASLPASISFAGAIMNMTDTDLCRTEQDEELVLPPQSMPKSNDAAYILYTSGSTGVPKGVVVEHRNLLAYVDAFLHEFQLNQEDVFLQQASCSFDQFVEEVYPVLLTGGKVVVATKLEVLDMPKLVERIHQHQITFVSCSPLLMNELNKQAGMDSVRVFISGGDVLKPEYMQELSHRAEVYNTYGPTEATVCATYHRYEEPAGEQDRKMSKVSKVGIDSIPIGKPILGYRVYVLDGYGHPAPIGVAGEICIAGAGVAREYLNRPELNAQAFVDDPYQAGARMYRTGDMGAWRSDGSLLYVGRKDQQVKIRGYRIELGEVESCLLHHEAVAEAIVLPQTDEHGIRMLTAFVKLSAEAAVRELREALAATLPAYMIPQQFYQVDHVPMTTNGKLDRQQLMLIAKPMVAEQSEGIEAHHASETESKLRRVWQEVLGLSQVGIHEHFFDLGGNSILLMQLHAKLEKEYAFGIQIVDLFSYTTIAKLAAWIDEREGRGKVESQPLELDVQEMPPSLFRKQRNGSGMVSIRFYLQKQLRQPIHAMAAESKAEALDVLAGMFLYLLSEWNEQPHSAIQFLLEGGTEAISIRLDRDAINGFDELFHSVHQRRTNVHASSYSIQQLRAASNIKREHDLLPLMLSQQELEIDAGLLEIYDLTIGIEDLTEQNEMSVVIKFNDNRLARDEVQMLVDSYIDLLRQLISSRVVS
ncbi:non-ribosomal peptide synthetase [Paenibacillus aquistagni]|uniref:non-ribosomal peptide synthetase n=1 Tax=Paenibacillus aquistagni TaxID=1852522 RepID=UPI000B508D7A|nr:non-ribosomal peptide synthetase [Paenibacillus aquistagni]